MEDWLAAVQPPSMRSKDFDPLRDVDTNAMSVGSNPVFDLVESGTNITDALSMTGAARELGDGYLLDLEECQYSPSSGVCMVPSTDLDANHGSTVEVSAGEHSMALQNFRLATQPSQPKFFWEQNNWFGHVFGGKDSVVDDLFRERVKFSRADAPLVTLPVSDSHAETSATGVKRKQPTDERAKPFYLDATSETTVEDEQATRMGLCTEWVNIVLINWEAFDFTVTCQTTEQFLGKSCLIV